MEFRNSFVHLDPVPSLHRPFFIGSLCVHPNRIQLLDRSKNVRCQDKLGASFNADVGLFFLSVSPCSVSVVMWPVYESIHV